MARKACLKLTVMPVWREISRALSSQVLMGRYRQTRSITPIAPRPPNDDNQNMSSGDESDDEDLTDADSSDSDWSDLAAGMCYKMDVSIMTYLRPRVV
jgi:hypothetical protein